jgi:predicted site-specific integrase-resolvase
VTMRADLLKPEEAAQALTVSEVTLRRWRQRKSGPAFIRLSRGIIRYHVDDIKQYLNARRQQ